MFDIFMSVCIACFSIFMYISFIILIVGPRIHKWESYFKLYFWIHSTWISLRGFLGKPDVIFGDSPLTSLDTSEKTGNESSHILLFQNHERVV